MTESRSIQRRIAAQKGEPAPDFSGRKRLLNPGSDEALKQGCICPVLDNCHGKGAYDAPDGMFWITEDCPIHGKKKNKENGYVIP